MEYVPLGPTGMEVSRLCFGTWRFGHESDGVVETDREQAHRLLDSAWDMGINFFDTANRYGDPPGTSETYIGDWLAAHDRDEFVIASKVCLPVGDGPNQDGLSRKHIREQIEGTLDRLGTDYLDLYYIHRWDEDTPIVETLRTLDELVADGRVHYIGASSMASWQLCKALWTSDVHEWEPFTVTQPPLDATRRSYDQYLSLAIDEYLDLCAEQDLAVCPYSPLAGGFLTGKYTQAESAPEWSRKRLDESFDDWYVSEQAWATLETVREVASSVDATPAQVALRWLCDIERFTTVPIVGARTVEQLEENVGAVDVSLSPDQHDRITDAGRQ